MASKGEPMQRKTESFPPMTTGDLEPEAFGELPPSGRQSAFAPGNLMEVRNEWIDFYDAHFRRAVRFVMHIGASQEAAEEAAQEAFLESWELMNKDPNRWQAIASKDAWIRTVAVRRYHRPPGPRRRVLTVADEIPDLPSVGLGHDELTAQAQLVLRALRILDEEPRMVTAYDLDGIPTADIATELGITEQRVRDVRKKARTVLRKALAENITSGGRQS
jgi:RNA polymerase sigma factor (sigma-70 family)